MSPIVQKIVIWIPRVLAILLSVILFVSALNEPLGWDILVHLLPAGVLIAFTGFSWSKPTIGGLGFLVLAVFSLFFFPLYQGIPTFSLITLPLILISTLMLTHALTKMKERD